jgi:hypothetical protein
VRKHSASGRVVGGKGGAPLGSAKGIVYKDASVEDGLGVSHWGGQGRAAHLTCLCRTFCTFPMSHLATFPDAGAMLAAMEKAAPTHNFVGTISCLTLASATLETALFPAAALGYYSALNLGEIDSANPAHAALTAAWYSPERGGPQGDYREGMPAKVANVVDALRRFPHSKRAVLTVPQRNASHEVDADAKCLRELHFWLGEDDRLHCSGFMRAQACSIFPKNVHFIASLLDRVAQAVGKQPGSYTHFVTTLTSGRE